MNLEKAPRQAATSLWLVAGLAMGPAVALGLARFAYALLLPAMRLDLGQCVGPALSGYLSDGPEGVRTGLEVSAAILLASAMVIAFQRERPAS